MVTRKVAAAPPAPARSEKSDNPLAALPVRHLFFRLLGQKWVVFPVGLGPGDHISLHPGDGLLGQCVLDLFYHFLDGCAGPRNGLKMRGRPLGGRGKKQLIYPVEHRHAHEPNDDFFPFVHIRL